MVVPLRVEHASEAPLVLFTTCVPAATGVGLCALLLGGGLPHAVLAVVLATLGMAGSIFHLARPFRAPFSLRNLARSPLSQEIGAVIVFWLMLALWLAAEVLAMLAAGGAGVLPAAWAELPWGGVSLTARVLAVACGALLLWVINRAYRVPTRLAWDGSEGLLELAGIACCCGGALYGALACAEAVAAGGWAAGGVAGGGATGSSAAGWLLASTQTAAGTGGVISTTSVGAVSPLGAAVPAVAAVLAIAGCALMASGSVRRCTRLERLAASGNEAAEITLKHMTPLRSKSRLALQLAAAGAAVELMCLALAFLPTFPAGLMLAWLGAAGLQVAAAVLLRTVFYELPVPTKHVAPLRK